MARRIAAGFGAMMIDVAAQTRLLALARDSMAHGIATGLPLPVRQREWLDSLWVPRATFVTLTAREGTRDGTREARLRGCRGRIEAVQPLPQDVAVSAMQAALDDPRFSPVAAGELPRLRIAISVLTPPEALLVADREALLAALVPHQDGLLITAGAHRATLLPKVWEQLPVADDFLAALWEKAGLRAGTWPGEIEIQRYRAIEFAEP